MSRRSPTRARLDALIFISRPRGVEYDRVATVQAARMDDAQLQEALQRIPARLAAARAAQDGRALIAVKRYRDALRAEADAREIMEAWAKRDSPKRKERAEAAKVAKIVRRAEAFMPRAVPRKKASDRPGPASGVTQVVRGGAPGLGKRA